MKIGENVKWNIWFTLPNTWKGQRTNSNI